MEKTYIRGLIMESRGRGRYLILNENGQLVDMNGMQNTLNNSTTRTVKGGE